MCYFRPTVNIICCVCWCIGPRDTMANSTWHGSPRFGLFWTPVCERNSSLAKSPSKPSLKFRALSCRLLLFMTFPWRLSFSLIALVTFISSQISLTSFIISDIFWRFLFLAILGFVWTLLTRVRVPGCDRKWIRNLHLWRYYYITESDLDCSASFLVSKISFL